jgi:hypothetical protein
MSVEFDAGCAYEIAPVFNCRWRVEFEAQASFLALLLVFLEADSRPGSAHPFLPGLNAPVPMRFLGCLDPVADFPGKGTQVS